jgi:hypothetical protein
MAKSISFTSKQFPQVFKVLNRTAAMLSPRPSLRSLAASLLLEAATSKVKELSDPSVKQSKNSLPSLTKKVNKNADADRKTA